ncbi:uncharacterized protein LOC116109323 [Pistacia vera]|uniref:uncharacterized protein LOC116109323 n=1 Tax=Pistacia vera TaxID=55513 RepID=UPI00126324D3|nr:uncharacterized protein LOC116109323 [Pistacia vera]
MAKTVKAIQFFALFLIFVLIATGGRWQKCKKIFVRGLAKHGLGSAAILTIVTINASNGRMQGVELVIKEVAIGNASATSIVLSTNIINKLYPSCLGLLKLLFRSIK